MSSSWGLKSAAARLALRTQAIVEEDDDRDPDLPSSIEMPVLLKDGKSDRVTVRVSYADYRAEVQEAADDGAGQGKGKKRGRAGLL